MNTFDEILNDLGNRIYAPVYFLFGEEPYFIDAITGYIEANVLSDAEKEFNQSVLYGRDLDIPTLFSYARRYPMMANYQVIILKEAQDLQKIEELQPYTDDPVRSTILVIAYKYGKLDKRKTFYKSLEKNGVVFESKKFYDNQVPSWISEYVARNGYSISTKATHLMAEFLGTDLSKIANEIDKLFINIPVKSEITEALVEKFIGISKDYNAFELQKALGRKDVYKANQIIHYFAANPREEPIVKIIPLLYSFFSKILVYHYLSDKSKNSVASALAVQPFFVTDYQHAATHYTPAKLIQIISILREYDLKAKGVDNISATDGELLKEMVFKILH